MLTPLSMQCGLPKARKLIVSLLPGAVTGSSAALEGALHALASKLDEDKSWMWSKQW